MTDLIRKAIEMSSDDYMVFLSLSPHCSMIAVDTHWGGWKEGTHATHSTWFYYDIDDGVDGAVSDVVDWLDADYLSFLAGKEALK